MKKRKMERLLRIREGAADSAGRDRDRLIRKQDRLDQLLAAQRTYIEELEHIIQFGYAKGGGGGGSGGAGLVFVGGGGGGSNGVTASFPQEGVSGAPGGYAGPM